MKEISCEKCYNTTQTKNILSCPNCGMMICNNCTTHNGGLCTNCYETVHFLN